MPVFAIIGGYLISAVTELGAVMRLFGQALRWSVQRPFRHDQLFIQLEFIGVASLSIILLTSFFTGAVMALQSSYAFGLFDANSMVGPAVALALTRELGPVMTALMIAGRCGSAMAAEIGTMRVTEQIDALTTMAVNPVQYLVLPRMIAAVIMKPLLAVVFDFIGTVGAWIVSTYLLDISSTLFYEMVVSYVDIDDFTNGLVKAAFFGLIIALVSCYKGFNTTRGAKGVGIATTESVVLSSVWVLVSDYFLTAILF